MVQLGIIKNNKFTNVIQIQKILASDGAANDQFSTSVAISTDASTILVGAPMDDDNGSNSGSAYVYARSGLQWILQAKLLASDGGSAGDEFGISVALSSNGDTAIVGAHLDDTADNNNRGRAYVYVRSGTTWTQQQKLLVSDFDGGDRFGISVALSASGDTALIGSYFDNTASTNNHASAYVFERSGTAWTQQQKLIASDFADGDRFGVSVDLSADGNTALVGAYRDDVSFNQQGSAYVFTRSGVTWSQQAKLVAADGAMNDEFGISVSLSSSGDIALVGGFLDDVTGTNQGSAIFFTGLERHGHSNKNYWLQMVLLKIILGIRLVCLAEGKLLLSDRFRMMVWRMPLAAPIFLQR